MLFRSFLSALEEGRPMSPDFSDGLEALRLAVAAEESLQTRAVVRLDVASDAGTDRRLPQRR